MGRHNTADVGEFINIGVDKEITIYEVAELIAEVVGFHSTLVFDATKPDGTPCKLLDVPRLHASGWQPRLDFATGLPKAY